MRILKNNVILRLYNSYLVDSPQPANISYVWNFGSLLATCLILQILTGCFLAMHYVANIDLAFNSIEHIMRDVENGYLIRYIHANVASFFFIFVYAHVGRNLYYGSFKSPRILVWSIGVIILILMMAIAFLGYVLPYGQMSLWGFFEALNAFFNKFYLINFNMPYLDYFLVYNIMPLFVNDSSAPLRSLPRSTHITSTSTPSAAKQQQGWGARDKQQMKKLRGIYRIGPHNQEIYSIIFGSLLGDAFAEQRVEKGGTRISFYQENVHLSYILWLHKFLSVRGYTGTQIPKPTTRLGKKGIVRKIVRFHTWTYTSFNWIQNLWYDNNVKRVPYCIAEFLTPLALAIWIMDDGTKVSKGLKLCTNSFYYSDCVLLVKVLNDNFSLKSSIQSAGAPNQYNIYIWKESMPLLRSIISPYIIPEMKYKIIE